MNFTSKPYKLYNKIQNYAWGTKNEDAFIPNLLNMQPETGKPYAELWIGAHPKAPSEIIIENERISLNELIDKYPKEILGESIVNKFGNNLPFLLKVLSASQALSIQTHPNKEQAVELHAADPKNYPDDNHKPEIAITIDSLSSLVGFRPVNEIIEMLKKRKEIGKYFGEDLVRQIVDSENEEETEKGIIQLFQLIMKSSNDEDLLKNAVNEIKDNLTIEQLLTIQEKEFLKQYKEYGNDIGLFAILFMNIVELKPGHAIFTGAGIPHAYLKGNIVECMANSDNVVRAGLTPKFKDVDTLLEILKYDFQKPEIMENKSGSNKLLYKCEADEFMVTSTVLHGDDEMSFNENKAMKILLLLNGAVDLLWDGSGFESYKKGDSVLIPAAVQSFKILSKEECLLFIVE
ncbi:MAG: mannose-6-phosphate isomerase, class I [Ignavibacteria bacterium]|jgi:mannose-6-phosphate isomerase